MKKYCPMCDLEMEHQENEPDVGIVGGWYCAHCDSSSSDEDDFDEDDWR
jgi:transposase-like protein